MSASKQNDKGEAETPPADKKVTGEGQLPRPSSSFTIGLCELVTIHGILGSSSLAVHSEEGIICEVNKFLDDYKANAELIAEAFNVATETGLTPRQLAEQRKELLDALTKLLEDTVSVLRSSPPDYAWSECSGCGQEEGHDAGCSVAEAVAIVARLPVNK